MPKQRRTEIVDLDWILGVPFQVVGKGKLEQLSDEEEAAVRAASALPNA